MLRVNESARAYHSFQYFREFSTESDRNFTCNSSPVIGRIGWGGATAGKDSCSALCQITRMARGRIEDVERSGIRLIRATSGLPTIRLEPVEARNDWRGYNALNLWMRPKFE
jgi:hypothetical protein